ncbi:MAG TPA: Uma2 family endonuclease, partial [Polyangiaceae bacterium]|nr:Uma2 family endonuclease [Polyangiaceae bacterium]
MSQAAAEERRRITYSEFCDLPLKDDRRYELIDGQIFADGQPVDLEEVLNRKPVFAMNQGSPRHARLAASLIIRLEMALGGRCHVLGPVGVYCEAMATAYAPDVVVVCEIPQLDPVRGRAIVNPRAIFEVLSSNTERIDKGTKLHHYRTLESLQEYVLVSQNERLV